MQKTKRWKLEDVYYGGSTKFDRTFVKNFEGARLPMHRLRDRRNWRDSHTWIRDKYTEGLIRKYINKPITALERAFNQRVKDVKNPYSFRECYSHIIYGLKHRKCRGNLRTYRYIVIDGIIRLNPDYKPYKYRKYPKFAVHHLRYNKRHVINPGAVRSYPLTGESGPYSGMKNEKPIYLGKLYIMYNGKARLADVYHYIKVFSEAQLRDPKIAAKKAQYEKDWVHVDAPVGWLDFFKDERNVKYDRIVKLLEKPDLSVEMRESYERMLKWTQPTIRNNYGIGHWLHTVCKRTDLE